MRRVTPLHTAARAGSRYIAVFLLAVLSATAQNALGAELIQLSPVGDVTVRTPAYSWTCAEAGQYRLQIRKAYAGVELTSDEKEVVPTDGVCTLPISGRDQLRLRAGTLPLDVPYQWFVRKLPSNEWIGGAEFVLRALVQARFGELQEGWRAIGPGWNDLLGSLTNDSNTGQVPEFYLWVGEFEGPAERQRLRERQDAYIRFSLNCDETVECEAGLILWAEVSPRCRDGELSECRPPEIFSQVAVDNRKRLSLRVAFNGLSTIHSETVPFVNVAGGTNYLRVVRLHDHMRVVLNGQQIYCGGNGLFNVMTGGALVGVSWKSVGVLQHGTGLEVQELSVAEGPLERRCAVPFPARAGWP